MRTLIYLGLALAALAGAPHASTAPPPKVDREELKPKACGSGKLVVNVHQQIRNDADSGTRGNVWALDDYQRSIKVWQVAPGRFCSIALYDGQFRTVAGPSPGGTGNISEGITGRFDGGYRMDFKAKLLARPLRRNLGDIGTFDYRCDASGRCPGSVYWVSLYFTNIRGDKPDWWGWLYRTSSNGTWLNSSDGVEGDIVDGEKKGRGKK